MPPELVIDPQDGTAPLVLNWTDGYGVTRPGPLGLGVPPRTLVEQVRGDGHGTIPLGVTTGPRDITIPLDVYGTSRAEFLRLRRRLQVICGRSNHLRPLRVIYREDEAGLLEWIDGVYTGGCEGEGERNAALTSEVFAVVVRAPSPYWRAPRNPQEWTLTPPTRRNWFPFLGRSPASSVVGGRRTVVNPGDVEVRATWVVQGPGQRLAIINHTAGWRMILDHTIPGDGPGSVITVVTEEGAQSVRDGHGVSLFESISNGPDGGWEMGPLLPGPNDIEVRLEEAGEGSSVLLAYDPLLLAV